MNIAFSPPDIQEKEIKEVIDTLHSGWITTGPKTKEFERNIASYCGTDKAVCLNSATACMELTLRLLGVGPGDEVITTAYTYTASASVVCHVGAKLVLVDTEKDTYEMDYQKLEEAITERTKVIIAVDLAGVICNYERIFQIAENKKHLFHENNQLQAAFGRIVVMADAAHAFGAFQTVKSRQKNMCGNIADFTCFSFHAVKNLTTAEGGAVTWKTRRGFDGEKIYQQYMLMSLHGQSKDALSKTKLGAWEYDIMAPYYKCNMTDIVAAIGLRQLDRYEEMIGRRKEIVQQYNTQIDKWNVNGEKKISYLVHDTSQNHSSRHLYMIRMKDIGEEKRNIIISDMAKNGVAVNVHYKPLPILTAYKNMGFCIEDYPNAYAMYENEITLPLHTGLKDEEVSYILAVLFDAVGRVSK